MSQNNNGKKKGNELDERSKAILETMRNTEVQKEDVVFMIENLVGKLGQIGAQAMAPAPVSQSPLPPPKREPSKAAREILEKLERAKNPENQLDLNQDNEFMEWMSRPGCKLKHYSDEFDCLRQVVEYATEANYLELARTATRKAISITRLHAPREHETLSELYWAAAELSAATGDMNEAKENLRQCVSYLEPGADESSITYRELWQQLQEAEAMAATAG